MAAHLTRPALAAILGRIAREQKFGSWGYAAAAPIDADDTAFALRTARNLGRTVDAAPLELFFHDRAFTTFEGGRQRERTRLAFDVCMRNNFRVHPEVLANIYGLLAEIGDVTRIDDELIRASQAAEGYFQTYFYPCKYYSTWLFLHVLGTLGRLPRERNRALAFLCDSQNRDGSWGAPGNVYETALALDACVAVGIVPPNPTTVRYLIENQHDDGSWSTSQAIWQYRHSDEPLVTWRAFDNNRVVATAIAVKALRQIEEQNA